MKGGKEKGREKRDRGPVEWGEELQYALLSFVKGTLWAQKT